MNNQTRIDPTLSVNDVLRLHPRTISVFNEYGIDACCGGANSLETAAQVDGAPLPELLEALERCAAEDA